MLFITNRTLNEGPTSKRDRKVSFNLDINHSSQSLFFCRRNKAGDYTEVMSEGFFQSLRVSKPKEMLFFIHGFNNMPEAVFKKAKELQALLNAAGVEVVPIVWPCDNDKNVTLDYYDDQDAADASSFAFARALEKFMEWRESDGVKDAPCLKRINILAHSMGNRVLRETIARWNSEYRGFRVPMLFRNIFMVAADVVNETLEKGQGGYPVTSSARNVAVFFAGDDLALRASKIANVRNRVASRRLGHTGPENMDKASRNVTAFDCDNFNNKYGDKKGHTYFTYTSTKGINRKAGKAFQAIARILKTGRADESKFPSMKDRVAIL